MKTCTVCGQPSADFPLHRYNDRGEPLYHSKCRTCYNAARRTWQQQYRAGKRAAKTLQEYHRAPEQPRYIFPTIDWKRS